MKDTVIYIICRACARMLRKVAFITGGAIRLLTVIPFAVVFASVAVLFDHIERYVDIAWLVAYVPFRWGECLRFWFYRITTEGVGRGTVFKFGSLCHYRKARLGNDVLVGFHTVLGEITIGDNVLIGSHVLFLSGKCQHGFDDPSKLICEQQGQRIRISIGDDVWIGSKATVMDSVGNRCVVAAGAVVVTSVCDGTLVGGCPARVLKRLATRTSGQRKGQKAE